MKENTNPLVQLCKRMANELPSDHPLRAKAFSLDEVQQELLDHLRNVVVHNSPYGQRGVSRKVTHYVTEETWAKLGELIKRDNPRTYCVCGFCGAVSKDANSHKDHLETAHRIKLQKYGGSPPTVHAFMQRRFNDDSVKRIRF